MWLWKKMDAAGVGEGNGEAARIPAGEIENGEVQAKEVA
jgi:hypothetical protein